MAVRRNCTMFASLTVVFTLMAGSAFAQDANAVSYTDLSQYLVTGNQAAQPQAFNSAAAANLASSVQQVGQSNYANANLAGTGNVTSQIQNGTGNSSSLSLNGAQNSVSTTQIGSSNTTTISVAGNGNLISNTQVGTGLSYQLQVTGTSQPISVQQYGRK
jgi:hypothetical protein